MVALVIGVEEFKVTVILDLYANNFQVHVQYNRQLQLKNHNVGNVVIHVIIIGQYQDTVILD